MAIPFATWAIAQVLKFALSAARGKLDFKYLYASGGMPSVHSAVVCSLATTALLVDGVGSPFFGFAALFAAIVMYDSFGVRRASGEQAAVLNMLVESLNRDRIKLAAPKAKLREIIGHNPLEVTIGAFLGVSLALLFNISRLTNQLNFLSAVPGRWEFRIYLGSFALLVVAGWITKIVLNMRYRKSAILKRLSSDLLLKTQVIGWLGLVASFSQYENIAIFSWRVWPMLLLGVMVVWDLWLVGHYWRVLPQALDGEREAERKRKWFQIGTGKRDRKRR